MREIPHQPKKNALDGGEFSQYSGRIAEFVFTFFQTFQQNTKVVVVLDCKSTINF